MRSGASLVATTFVRSWRRHRLRAVATLASAVIGIMLATMVAGIISSILTAVDGGTGLEVVDSDLVAGSRNPAGMAPDVVTAVERAGDGAATARVTFANSRIAGGERAVITILGLDGDTRFVPDFADVRRAAGVPDDALQLTVTEQWAERNGLGLGDTVRISGPGGGSDWVIAGTTPADLPNDGAIALARLGDVQEAFDRSGVDAVFFQTDGASTDAVRHAVATAAGQAAIVGTEEDVIAPEQTSFAFVRQILLMVGVVGLLTAGTVLFVCWRLMIEDERDNVARLRLVGTTPRSLAAGSGMIFLAATVVAAVVGVPLGLLAAGGMTSFAEQVVNLTGLAASPKPPAVGFPAAAGLAAGLFLSGLAWAAGLRSFLKVPAIEAIRGPAPDRGRRAPVVAPLAAGVVMAGLALVGSRTLPAKMTGSALVLAMGAAVAFAVALPGIFGRVMHRFGGFAAMSAGREFSAGARRRVGMISVLSVALILSIALAGTAQSLGNGLRTSVEAWTEGDLFVMPAEPGINLRDEKFPPSVPDELEQLPAVDRVVEFTFAPIKYEDRNVQLYAWNTDGVEDLVHLNVDEGRTGHEFWQSLASGGVAVSTNFAWLEDVEVGDTLRLPSAAGTLEAPIVATVDDYTGDTGVIFMGYDTYETITGDPRPFDLIVQAADGSTVDEAAAQIRDELGSYPGLTVWTGDQMEEHLLGLYGQVLGILNGMGMICLVLAILVGVTTAVASLGARRVSIGLSRLVGATTKALGRQITLESLSVGFLAWLIAFPVGIISVRVMVYATGAQSGTFPPVQIPWGAAAGMLVAALVAAGLAVWVPTRRLLRVDVIETVRYE
jgi:putative ABC transport system permease protein